MTRRTSLELPGFKPIRELPDLRLERLNVLIGANVRSAIRSPGICTC